MLARKVRVLEEPLPEEKRILVRVHHVTCGIVERAFKLNAIMASVYDWVGSLNITPEHFVLSNYNHDFMPDEPIYAMTPIFSIVLYMRESQHMPPLGEDINFKGFGDHADDNDSTLQPCFTDYKCPQPIDGRSYQVHVNGDILISCLKQVVSDSQYYRYTNPEA